MIDVGQVNTFLLGVIAVLVGVQVKQNSDLGKKLQKKKDKDDCERDKQGCARGPGWETFDKHSHEGLAPGSRVIKGT